VALVALALALPAAASAATQFPLQLEVSGEGSVSCSANGGPAESCESEYEEGTQLTLLAEPEEGSELLEWQGDCDTVAGNECEVLLDEAKAIEAVFAREEFALEVTTEGEGEGSVECGVEHGPTEPCQTSEAYPYGTEVNLYAEAEPGSQFSEWSGACSGEEAECDLTVEEDLSVGADFEPGPFYALNVEEPGTGEGSVECEIEGSAQPCQAEYTQGTVVTLIAEASPGSEFIEWAGECDAGAGNICEVEVNGERTVEVFFEEEEFSGEYFLTIAKAGTGTGTVECKVNGASAEACLAKYPQGTELDLVAKAAAGSTFTAYSAGTGSATGCSASPCSFKLEAHSKLTATFNLNAKPKFALKVKKTGTGAGKVTSTPSGIDCGAECEAQFTEGTTVTLAQSAEAGSEFVKWTGACTGAGACEVTMSAAKEVTAEFKAKAKPEFKLTIAKAGSGSGSVTCNAGACASTYPEGTVVTLAATPASGSTFAGWSGAGCSGTATCKVTINADTTVTATFNAEAKKEEAKKEEPKKEEPKPAPEGTAKAAATATVKSGKAELRLTCAGGPCKGTIALTAKVKQGKKTKSLVIGKASFSIAAGATATLKVKLSGPAKSELAKGKALKAKASGAGVSASTVKLKPAKKKH
jgi:hypothetical protein